MNKSLREVIEPLLCQYLHNKTEYIIGIRSEIDFTSLDIDMVHNRVDSLILKLFEGDEI